MKLFLLIIFIYSNSLFSKEILSCTPENNKKIMELEEKSKDGKKLTSKELKWLELILANEESGKCNFKYLIDYQKVAEIIANTKDSKLIRAYLNFMKTNISADEGRSFGLAKIYTSNTEQMLKFFSFSSEKDLEKLMNRLVWGLTNIHYQKFLISRDREEIKKEIVNGKVNIYSGKYATSALKIEAQVWQGLIDL